MIQSTEANEQSSSVWLKRARIISAIVYILILITYFIFLIVCIVRYPRCEKASDIPWWINSVFLRFTSRHFKLNDISEKLNDYKINYSMQVIWIGTVLPLSNQSNPIEWSTVDQNLGGESALNNLINKLHENNIRIIVDYPLNHLSIQSHNFQSNDDSYFVWNDYGNTSNWLTINNKKQSAWTYNERRKSFYLHQFDNNDDSIDINYRNNRVFNDIIHSFDYWSNKVDFDGFNLQGISYAYEDYEYKNEIDENLNRTRHLEEDYLLLGRIRSEINQTKILMFDPTDSFDTLNDQILTRYYGDRNGYLGGVQLASFYNYILIDEFQTNLTKLFDNYYNSIFFKEKRPLLWSSLSTNSKLNEAFFSACLFHVGSISIDIDRQGQYFTNEQLSRLKQIQTLAQTLDVFRVGHVQQDILTNSKWLTIERTRRGSKHYMIIINLNSIDQEDQIELKQGVTNAVEVVLSNIQSSDEKYEINSLIDMSQKIQLKSYEYLVIRWSPNIEGLGIIF